MEIKKFEKNRECPKCTFRYIPDRFCSECKIVNGEHLHKKCLCGYEWVETCADNPSAVLTDR